MAESKTFRSQRNRSLIDVNDPLDVGYVHYQFPWLSHERITEVIKTYGPDRDAVHAALQQSGSSRHEEDE